MNRRAFIAALGGAAAWPLGARAQHRPLPVVGFLGSASPDLWADRLRAFALGLRETGYVEGQNVTIEYRWAEGRNDRLPALAADLVRRSVTVIAPVGSTEAALAAKAATSTIPIIFSIGGDPVALGLVAGLNRPGANVTGVATLTVELEKKRLELLHELVPTATVVGLLVNPTNPIFAESATRDAQVVAHTFGFSLAVLHASTERDFDVVFATLAQRRVGALVIGSDAFFSSKIEQLGTLTARHAVPAVHWLRAFAAAGGLVSYGASVTDAYRRAGGYVGRILDGSKPADLPVEQSTKFELVINLKTAKTLGLTVPIPLLARADEVIE